MKRRNVTVSLIVLVLLTALQSPAAAEDWLVRTWTYTGGGAVDVTLDNGTYTGIVTDPITFSAGGCTHPAGERIWVVTSRGNNTYHGAMSAFWSDCTPAPGTVDLVVSSSDGQLSLDMCLVGGTGCRKFTGGAAPDPDAAAPEITIEPLEGDVPLNTHVWVDFRVKDDMGTAYISARVYDGGKLTWSGDDSKLTIAKGDVIELDLGMYSSDAFPMYSKGPYYFCVSARDVYGNATGDFDHCVWLSVEVPANYQGKYIGANGCGGDFGQWAIGLQKFMLDKRTYKWKVGSNNWKMAVPFSPACNNHDAGYDGITMRDQISGELINYRTWSRLRVDNKFKNDIVKLCKKYLGNWSSTATKNCSTGHTITLRNASGQPTLSQLNVALLQFAAMAANTKTLVGADTYRQAVRFFGRWLYDTDVSKPGLQLTMVTSTVPPGAARDNR